MKRSSYSSSNSEMSEEITVHEANEEVDRSVIRELSEMATYNENLRTYLDNKKKLEEITNRFNEKEISPMRRTLRPERGSPRHFNTPITPDLSHPLHTESPYPLPFLTPSPAINMNQYQRDLTQQDQDPQRPDESTNEAYREDSFTIAELNNGLEDVRNTLAEKDKRLREDNIGIEEDQFEDIRSDVSSISSLSDRPSQQLYQSTPFSTLAGEEKLRNEVIRLRRELDVLTQDRAAMVGRLEIMQRETERLRDDLEHEKRSARTVKSVVTESNEGYSEQIVDIQYGKVSLTFQKAEEQYKDQISLLKNKINLQSKEIEDLYAKVQDVQKDKMSAQKTYLQREQEKDEQIYNLTQQLAGVQNDLHQMKTRFEDFKRQAVERNDALKNKLQSTEEKLTQSEAQNKILGQKLNSLSSNELSEKTMRSQLEQQLMNREISYKQEINRLQQEVSICNSDLADAKSDFARQIDRMKKQYSEQQRQVQADFESTLEKLQKQTKEIERLEKERSALNQQNSEYKQRVQEGDRHLQLLNKELHEISKREQEQSSIIRRQLTEEQTKFREYMNSYDLKYGTVQRQVLNLEREKDILKEQNKSLLFEQSSLKERYRLSLKELNNQVDQLKRELASQKAQNNHVSTMNVDMMNQLHHYNMNEQIASDNIQTQLNEHVTLYEYELQKLDQERMELNNHVKQLESEILHRDDEISTLKAQLRQISLQESESYRSLLEAAKREYEAKIQNLVASIQNHPEIDRAKKLADENTELKLKLELLQKDFDAYKKRTQSRGEEEGNDYRQLRDEYNLQLTKLKNQFEVETTTVKNKEWIRAKRSVQRKFSEQLKQIFTSQQTTTTTATSADAPQPMIGSFTSDLIPLLHQLEDENEMLSEELFRLQEEYERVISNGEKPDYHITTITRQEEAYSGEQATIDLLSKQLDDSRREFDNLAYECNRLNTVNQSLENKLKIADERERTSKELVDEMKSEIEELRTNFNTSKNTSSADAYTLTVEKQNIALKSQLKRAEAKLEQIEQENKHLKEVQAQQRSLQLNVQEQIASIEQSIQEQERASAAELKKSNNQITILKEQVRALEERCEVQDQEIYNLQTQTNLDKKKMASLTSRLELVQQENDSLKYMSFR